MKFLAQYAHLIRENEPLAPYTWLEIGGPARYFAEPTTVEELAGLVAGAAKEHVPVRVIGGGSNLLVQEAGCDGLVLHLSAPELAAIRIDGQRLIAGGGAKLSHVISRAVGAGLAGLEHLVGIPGTLGGAVVGNAGVVNGDIGSHVERVTTLDRQGNLIKRQRAEVQFSFRRSDLDDVTVVEVELGLEPGDAAELTRRMQNSWIVKRAGQPPTDQRAALAFVDPSGITAAELIEQCGLKGAAEGEASLSGQYPGYIIVSGNATSQQVLALLDRVRKAIAQRTGIQLQSHLRIW
ncbi:MAG: UDP-N-acetylmuramate dehydrogenase [Aureliella sp.]|jgi:UDP-N-acetylmuramate dehydrogenase